MHGSRWNLLSDSAGNSTQSAGDGSSLTNFFEHVLNIARSSSLLYGLAIGTRSDISVNCGIGRRRQTICSTCLTGSSGGTSHSIDWSRSGIATQRRRHKTTTGGIHLTIDRSNSRLILSLYRRLTGFNGT
jgi:hypothetical protein